MDVSNINTISLQSQFNSLTLDYVNKINLSKNSEKLLSQIEITLQEGGGECIYEVYDDNVSNLE
jgi:hypothetical protein